MAKKKSFRNIYRQYRISTEVEPINGITCLICGAHIKSKSGLGSHLLNKHGMLLEEYIVVYFKNLTPSFEFQSCGFCYHDAQPLLKIDYMNQTYKLSYELGYDCNTDECIDARCQHFFGKSYNESKSQFEHLGSKTEYLVKLYKTTVENVKQTIKHNPNYVAPIEAKSSLAGYIARHGKEKGEKLYKERCDKIAYSLTIDWYIERYGIEEGTKKFQMRQSKLMDSTKDIMHSKHQYDISDALKKVDPDWEDERYCGGFTRIDIVNKRLGVAVEYFGDYWHCNPEIYDDDFFNKSLKCTAVEKQECDRIRLNKILVRSKHVSLIIVVWEKRFNEIKDCDIIQHMIYDMIKKHNKNKKEILWL